ncbi:MAG: NADH-ubiquinone oxidoreductase-F iron-sulfur binding region domain-containing protein [Bdellovibrionota bacterium]|jgi:NADH:ubiquinone oxidoreductase subunit F (NADH-binding)/Pyruvate/2-oxoacid:ferredoxin oxidoreductase delta subunit/(2Fe-2S) ferredoxin
MQETKKPCQDLINYFSGTLEGDALERVNNYCATLRREDVERPVIFVGAGTCGLGAGAGKTLDAIKEYVAENGLDVEIIEVGCIGLCSAEPLVDIQLPGRTRVSFQEVTHNVVKNLLKDVFADKIPADHVLGQFTSPRLKAWDGVPNINDHPFFKPQTRWVLSQCGKTNPRSIEEYIANDGYKALSKVIKTMDAASVCDEVEKSGLRGRGGGGFSTGKKWKFALQEQNEQKYIVCNADEGDPGAFMDRAVIEGNPHQLLEGMAIAAFGIGASKAYVYIRAEYPLAIARLKEAIADATAYGLLGENILGTNFSLEIIIKMGAGAFVCGEETALLHSIEGKRGMPRPRPPFPAVKGLFGKPTVINNVETLANIPGILRNGSAWFSSIGTPTSKGTKVFALSGKVNRTGLVEVAMGTKVEDIVFGIGGGIPNGKAYKSVQIGGPSGGCIPQQHIGIEVDYESLKTVGAMMGSGGLVVMDEDTCMVDVAKFFMEFIQRESCGKCVPCREGTRRLLETLESITSTGHGGEKGDHTELKRMLSVVSLERLANVVKDSSLCGLGQTAPNPVLSTLKFFRDEYEAHVFERRCPAGECKSLRKFEILADKCTGCTACARSCPVVAITGTVKQPHTIDQDKCIACGACIEKCKFNAIVCNK